MSAAKKICPLLEELKQKAYKATKGQELMKYLNVINKLAVQGDVAYCDGRYDIAFLCYYGLARTYQDFVKNHPDAKETRFAHPMSVVKEHYMMAVPRLEELVPLIEKMYEELQNQLANPSAATPGAVAGAIGSTISAAAAVPGVATASAEKIGEKVGGLIGRGVAGPLGAYAGKKMGSSLGNAVGQSYEDVSSWDHIIIAM